MRSSCGRAGSRYVSWRSSLFSVLLPCYPSLALHLAAYYKGTTFILFGIIILVPTLFVSTGWWLMWSSTLRWSGWESRKMSVLETGWRVGFLVQLVSHEHTALEGGTPETDECRPLGGAATPHCVREPYKSPWKQAQKNPWLPALEQVPVNQRPLSWGKGKRVRALVCTEEWILCLFMGSGG